MHVWAAYSLVSDPKWQNIEIVQGSMHVFVTSNLKKDQIDSSRKKVETSILLTLKGSLLYIQWWELDEILNKPKLLCMSLLPSSMERIRFEIAEKDDVVFHYNVNLLCFFQRTRAVGGQNWLKFKQIQDFIHVLITCKFEKDWFNSNQESDDIEFLDTQRQITPSSEMGFGQNSNSSKLLCMSSSPASMKGINEN